MFNRAWKSVLLSTLIVPLGMWSAHAAVLPPSVNTSATPSVVTLYGTTYAFYKGSGSDPGIYMTTNNTSIEFGTWTNAVRLPWQINTSAAPAAVVIGSDILVVYKGSGNDSAIYIAASLDGAQSWMMTKFPSFVSTSTGPGAFVSGDNLYVFYKGSGEDARIYLTPIISAMQWQLLP